MCRVYGYVKMGAKMWFFSLTSKLNTTEIKVKFKLSTIIALQFRIKRFLGHQVCLFAIAKNIYKCVMEENSN